MKNVCILGSTGSIGNQTIEVINSFPEEFKIHSIAAYGRNPSTIISQIKKLKPELVAVYDNEVANKIKKELNIKVLVGLEGLLELVSNDKIDLVVSAMVGFIGLKPTIKALENNKQVALANKESVVVGGEIIKKYLDKIIPVDSEHSAVFQLIQNIKENKEILDSIILTASGGPFWRKKLSSMKKVSIEDALKHPVWKMGSKITIDSATLMNKALEIIEAYFLFSIQNYETIKAVIHPQAYVHAMIVTKDNNTYAHISKPDMKIPISFALFYPKRIKNNFSKFSYLDLLGKKLEFYDIPKHFRSIDLAYSVLAKGGVFPTILNASNEVAVDLFLKGKIEFLDIFRLVEETLACYSGPTYTEQINIEILEEIDNWTRKQTLTISEKSKIFIKQS
jgi:1-deoxy-D-xylulose-5-phosphate reductoisomerase